MDRRPLGRTGLDVSILGLGGAGIANLYQELTDDEAVAVVCSALDRGIRYVDTAPLYGYGASERRVGAALRLHPKGHECIVGTKLGYVPDDFDYSFDATIRSVEASRERLGLAQIPIVQIHEIRPEIWDPIFAPRGALAALRKLRDDGVVGHLGVTGSDAATVQRALNSGEFETVFYWHHFHLLDDAGRAVLDQAARSGVGALIGTPFAGGVLASGSGPDAKYFYRPAADEIQARVRPIEDHCRLLGISLRAAALRFCLRHPAVAAVVAGADTPIQVAENATALDEAIPDEFWMRS
jgi:D-threo-aldose 1-dehydrogenase